MTDAEETHPDILRRGAAEWNKWRAEHPDIEPDLHKAWLIRYDLQNADLHGVNLDWAELLSANLTGVDLSGARLHGADARDAKFVGADLRGADLSGAVLLHADLSDADLTGCRVYGVSAWNVKLDGATQADLVITRHDEPKITVDDLQVAQFVYLLLNNANLRNVLNAMTDRGVLILGRFSDGGLDALRAVADELRRLEYIPMIFDFARPDDRDYTETVKILVGLSRFVVVDVSGPSVPQELYATVPHFSVPFVPILQNGRKIPSTLPDLLKYDWFLNQIVRYNDVQELGARVETDIVAPAEEKNTKRRELIQSVFAFR